MAYHDRTVRCYDEGIERGGLTYACGIMVVCHEQTPFNSADNGGHRGREECAVNERDQCRKQHIEIS